MNWLERIKQSFQIWQLLRLAKIARDALVKQMEVK